MNRKRMAIAILVILGVTFLVGVLAPPMLGSEEHDRSIMLQNNRDQNITVTVTVKYQSWNIYRETHTVAAHSDVEVAKLSANPLHIGRQSVRATVTDSYGESASLQLRLNDCYGPAEFYFEPDGEFEAVPYGVVC
jgi:hypothetical protein